MIWLTWRQLRGETIGLGILMLCVAGFVVVTGIEMRGFEGGLACLSVNASSTCGGQGDFERTFNVLLSIVGWFNVIPLVIGVFVGAPLVSRELERGTFRLAWTQSVTRTRWLAVKFAAVALIAVVFGVVMAAMLTWWRQPFDVISSPFATAGFDVEGLMPGVYALFALALGVAAGVVVRRVLPAMAVTLALFLAVRFPIEFLLRPHYMTPILTKTLAGGPGAPLGAWVLDAGLVDHAGNPVPSVQVLQACGQAAAQGAEKISGACLSSHGWFDSVTYQPLDRFWPFQGIEAGIYVALSAALLLFAVVSVRRRIR